MKNLFISLGICFAVSTTAKSQTNINLEKLNQKTTSKVALRFIEDIELVPDGGGSVSEPVAEKITVAKVIETPAKIEAPGRKLEDCAAWQFKYAMMLDVEVESLTNSKLYAYIDEWWATRYRYGGSTKAGVDCSAFSGGLMNNVYSVTVPRTARDQYAASEKIERADLKEGDLVFFNTRGGVSHVGVYLGNNYFVHSSTSDGVTISSLNENYYNSRFISGGRIKATAEKTEE
ncbi:C40 family peptidase [Ferruginibacter sp. SUN002]|uniref:C40 family peptidase n=1 Tax=Ferruginibacter sp. SUN002 TaxID=2937789 RepID=UPI003D361F50